MRRPLHALTFIVLAAAPALAEQDGRFAFQSVDGGLLRLDTRTGQVSQCQRAGEGFACRAVADDRAALQDEIDRLRQENDALRRAARGAPGAAGPLRLPTEGELDQALDTVEGAMRRLLRTFREELGAGRPANP